MSENKHLILDERNFIEQELTKTQALKKLLNIFQKIQLLFQKKLENTG